MPPTAPAPIKTGLANHFRGIEAVGGRLTLDRSVLVFKPHRLNFQRAIATWPTSTIVGVSEGGRFNVIAVTFADGSVARFVVYRRKKWIAAFGRAGEAK